MSQGCVSWLFSSLNGQSATIPAIGGSENCTACAMQRRTNLMRSDRLGYVAGGSALIVWALRRPSLAQAAAAGLAGWLLYPAYTGRTPERVVTDCLRRARSLLETKDLPTT